MTVPDYTRSRSGDRELVSARVDEDVLEEIEDLVDEGEFENRSEAIRVLLAERIRSY